ncbi:hypothetical protein GCM10010116_61450 [Microbispora rosea subsp. aerata]|nr:hypothetical protein GCM10010116_61450 [Microbispora rosea subsp. aerata]GLJ85415.1 hypothetical protein GCM10017588_41470 [Microbispora rosea subsp. aerata]
MREAEGVAAAATVVAEDRTATAVEREVETATAAVAEAESAGDNQAPSSLLPHNAQSYRKA